MIIIGIGHKSRQGKDTFAGFLMTYLRMNTRNKKIVKAGFADPLKDVCHKLYGWAGVKSKDYYDKNELERKTELPLLMNADLRGEVPIVNVVDLWITIGNHMRKFDMDVWMRALMKGTDAGVLVITDVRYPNEAQAILDHGGHIVKIVRPDHPGLNSTTDNALNTFNRWTTIIHNDQDLAHLHKLAGEFAQTYCKEIL